MNHVFLSGIAETAPRVVSQGNGVFHTIMNLTVIHKTVMGVEKQEQYPISAWRGIAKRMTELIMAGSRVSIKGYLSQKQTPDGIYLEVTVEEFHVSSHDSIARPPRRNSISFHLINTAGAEHEEPNLNQNLPIGTNAELSDPENSPVINQE